MPVPEFENDPSDDAMQLIAERQWEDLRELRLVSESSSEYRTAVNRLARRIAEIATEVSRVGSTTAVPMTDEASTAEDDMAPGIVELLAEAEQEMPKLEETMKELGRTIENFGELAEEATREMAAADARGKGFAGRLAATNRFAKRLEEPAERIENLGQLYASQLGAIDPGVHTLLDAAISEEASASEAREFFAGIHELLEESSPVMAQLSELAASLDQGARMSRALRTPVRRIQSGLKGVTDAQGIIEDWDQRAQELESALPTGLASDSDAYPPRASDISTE